MDNKVCIEISFYFRVHGAEIFGGENSIGYASQTHIDVNGIDFSRFEEIINANADKVISSFAEILKIPTENFELISREEFEAEADTDILKNSFEYYWKD